MAVGGAFNPVSELDPGLVEVDVFTLDRDEVYSVIAGLPFASAVREEIAETAVDDLRINYALATIREYDHDTYTHVIRVAAFARHLAVISGFNEREQKVLLMGAMLHDLGKVDIDPAIINSPNSLTEEERTQINRHPEFGFHRAKALFEGALEPCYRDTVPQVVLTHHRHNASAVPYPSDEALQVLATEGAVLLDELEAPALQETTELIAVADVYDAITSGRSYNSGRFDDPRMVRRVLEDSHPTRPREVDSLIAFHYVRFPGGIMPGSGVSSN